MFQGGLGEADQRTELGNSHHDANFQVFSGLQPGASVPGPWFPVPFSPMTHYNEEMRHLKESLLAMASHAESAVARAMRSLVERDDALARKVQDDDSILDQYEI